jgi:acetolactate synthase-1/2/3 large subunit
MRIDKSKDVRPAIDKAIKTKKTVVMEFICAEEEDVWPMVPAGAPISKMLDEKDYTLV